MSALRFAPLPLLVLISLAGCVPAGDTAPTSPPPSASATPTPTSTESTPDPVATPTNIPVTLGCDELVSPQAVYDYNPNFGLTTGYAPDAGSLAAEAVAAGGVACRWTNQTSGENIDVSVARLDESQSAARKAVLATTSESVTLSGVEGYFQRAGETGVADAFAGPYWIVATSTAFFEVGDVVPIVEAVVVGLG